MNNWQPRCPTPPRLVRPLAIDPAGLAGPTRGRADGPKWRRTSPGLFVPSDTKPSPEQRILEAWSGVPYSLVTGWAALRLGGGGFFDGLASDGQRLMDVPLLVNSARRPRPRELVRTIRVKVLPESVVHLAIACAVEERAVLDAMCLAGDERSATVVLDMAAAAEITSIGRVRRYLGACPPRTGGAKIRRALTLASERSRSPRETELRLIWTLDAGYPTPLVNQPVFALDGALIGVADLFDPESGVAGEYDGEHHRSRARHRRDVQRAEGFREVGIETFAVVAGDPRPQVVGRIRAAYARAKQRTGQCRGWSLTGGWDEATSEEAALSLDDLLTHREQMAAVYAQLDAAQLDAETPK